MPKQSHSPSARKGPKSWVSNQAVVSKNVIGSSNQMNCPGMIAKAASNFRRVSTPSVTLQILASDRGNFCRACLRGR